MEVKQENTISCGYSHAAAITSEGKVVCWGDNARGQCSLPDNLDDVVAVKCGFFHTVALLGDGTLVSWGENEDNRRTIPDGLESVFAISCGGYIAVVTESGR
jgi:alpha-tubulin suppressor-like RCC1 family protein